MPINNALEALRNLSSAPDREEEVKNVTHNRAVDFLEYVLKNPHEREKLQDATGAEIVQAGKAVGYDFTESDLDVLILRYTDISTMPMAKLGCHADPEGDTAGIWDPK